MDLTNYHAAVEVCPHCEFENEYPYWDVRKQGFTVRCQNCGEEILLCDECLHEEDNPEQTCDWKKVPCGGRCFRSVTVSNSYKENYKTAVGIVECFEDVLEDRGILVPDDDRPEDNDAPLYGATWGDLVEKIVEILSIRDRKTK